MSLPPIRILETPRLWLKPLVMSDAEAIQRQFPHWEIVQHMGAAIPWPYPADGAETFLRKVIPEMADGVYHWGLWPKDGPDHLIGIISLRPNSVHDQRGFWLAQPFHGQGLMTEAADRVLDFAFDDCGMPEITLTNAIGNVKSGNVKRRQGATLVGLDTITTTSGEQARQIWRLTAEEWKARRNR
jgi:RimJ/RimL family protein N-acetyltransferase